MDGEMTTFDDWRCRCCGRTIKEDTPEFATLWILLDDEAVVCPDCAISQERTGVSPK
jgi:hypothetical protein